MGTSSTLQLNEFHLWVCDHFLGNFKTVFDLRLAAGDEHALQTAPAYDTSRLRPRVHLPRSPLFYSQRPSSSPERPELTTNLTPQPSTSEVGTQQPVRQSQLTVSLTPRVQYGTSGQLFSQPARRPRRYRPRTISYSYEESDRASCAYEQEYASDSESNGSDLPPARPKTLQDELHGSYESGSSPKIDIASSPPIIKHPHVSLTSPEHSRNRPTALTGDETDSSNQSPQFQLPPPFSATSRQVSAYGSLPSGNSVEDGAGEVAEHSSEGFVEQLERSLSTSTGSSGGRYRSSVRSSCISKETRLSNTVKRKHEQPHRPTLPPRSSVPGQVTTRRTARKAQRHAHAPGFRRVRDANLTFAGHEHPATSANLQRQHSSRAATADA
jgi:hypothetical protein